MKIWIKNNPDYFWGTIGAILWAPWFYSIGLLFYGVGINPKAVSPDAVKMALAGFAFIPFVVLFCAHKPWSKAIKEKMPEK